ncbi:hypothetical protein KUTeg_015940 [Tegillarca granosa]|uniref:Uncharacterized protein n=1 Tax=Tegillarca granosa TaxID=220873 RepID=A0ABQ9EP99_TEGGR|nr:hypothetical protein KUTeg_015940 [Tegillarca granosa]
MCRNYEITLLKDQDCLLTDMSRKNKWKIKITTGTFTKFMEDEAQNTKPSYDSSNDKKKLIAEVGESNPDMRRLRSELAECNQIFLSLSTAAKEEESRHTRSPEQQLSSEIDKLTHHLNKYDQELVARVQEPMPRDKAWEGNTSEHMGELEKMKQTHASLRTTSPILESKYNMVLHKWDNMWTQSQAFRERMKAVNATLSGLEAVRQLVADYEIALVSHDDMTSNQDTLRNVREEVQDLQTSIQQQQPKIDNLKRDVANLRTATEQSRTGTSRHYDVEGVEKELNELDSRSRSLGTSSELLSLYANGLQGEQQWVLHTQNKIDNQPPLSSDVMEVKQLLEPTMAIYNGLGERQHQIEAVNRHGGQYIREAKCSFDWHVLCIYLLLIINFFAC